MYKRIKITKKIEISFEIFPATRKNVDKVWRTGVYYRKHFEANCLYFTLWRIRFVINLNKDFGQCPN